MSVTKVRPEDLLRLSDAADFAGTRGRTSLHVAALSGAIPYLVIGGQRFFTRADLETWAKPTTAEAAQLAQVAPAVVEGAAADGTLQCSVIQGIRHFDVADLTAWARKRGFPMKVTS